MLFISLVRPILVNGSIIWEPGCAVHINSIESVQKQFLIFCLRDLGWNSYELLPYRTRLAMIKLPTFKSHLSMMSTLFILGLIRGHVDSEFLPSRVKFNVPPRSTRNFELLSLHYYRSDYENNDHFRRGCKTFNDCYQVVDFSGCKDVLYLMWCSLAVKLFKEMLQL